jgi:hypothetical protein
VRREAFVHFLTTAYRGPHTGQPLPAKTAPYYASCVAKAERTLGEGADDLDLSDIGLVEAVSRLQRAGSAGTLSAKMVGNCSSALRAYAQFARSGAGATAGPESPRPPLPPKRVPAPAPIDPRVADKPVKELLGLHGAVLEELRRRGVIRTTNNPAGDFAETLFARAFGWTLANNSALGYDATDAAGQRYQIKSRRLTAHNPSRQLSFIRRLPERAFDTLAAVLFDEVYGVWRAILLPHELIEPRARFSSHANGWLLLLEDKVWDLAGARDVTEELRAAADKLG